MNKAFKRVKPKVRSRFNEVPDGEYVTADLCNKADPHRRAICYTFV